jgi:hypothetical protein
VIPCTNWRGLVTRGLWTCARICLECNDRVYIYYTSQWAVVLPSTISLPYICWASGQWFHQSGRTQSGIGRSPVQSKWKVGLDWTTDCQSWTGRAWSGPVHTHLQFRPCFIVKYHWKHDSSSHLITTHLWIPTLGEIRTVQSVYSVTLRYISPDKWPIQWEIYPNPGHSAGLIYSSPMQSSPGPTELEIGPKRVQNSLGLDWAGLWRTRSRLVHC